MADDSLQPHAFGEDEFFNALTNEYCTVDAVRNNDRARYLFDYLKRIGTLAILVERNYTDGDYVDDFASYYVKCFERYSIRCKRLHFFAFDPVEMTPGFIADVARGRAPVNELDRLARSYLGFLVARPLPIAIIGRTVLRTYDADGGRRNFPALLKYTASLMGIGFSLDSLAFQEQDTVIAACATVALWSALHKSADLFRTHAPRPSAITKWANQVVSDSRSIPSKGLIIEQMCSAIGQQGLEQETFRVVPDLPLRSLLYGYLQAGLVPIVIVQIEGMEGLHAVTFAGYSLQAIPTPPFPQNIQPDAIPMIGRRIDAFYGHDDQVGPFAKHRIEGASPTYHKAQSPFALAGTWHDTSGGDLQMYPVQIIIPVYNKIRVSFTDVQPWLARLDAVFGQIIGKNQKYEWDLFLTTTNAYKEQVRDKNFGSELYRYRVLLKQHPRFMWRALLRIFPTNGHANTVVPFEMLFDATDIPNSFTTYCTAFHHEQFRAAVHKVFTDPELEPLLVSSLTEKLWTCVREASVKAVFFYPQDQE